MKPSSPDPSKSAPATPAADGDPAVVKRYRRRRRMWLAVKLLTVALVLVLAAAIYLQTAHAMRHLILPFASRALGTRVTADSGSVGLGGTLNLSGLRIQGRGERPALEAERIHVAIAPGSLLGGGLPTIRAVEVVRPNFYCAIDAAGRGNWSFLTDGAESTDKNSAQSFPVIRLQNLSVKGLKAEYVDAAGLDMRVENLDLSASAFAPGSTGVVTLDLQSTLERAAEGIRQESAVNATFHVQQKATGDAILYDGALKAELKGLGAASDLLGTMQIASTFDGTMEAAGRLQQKMEVTATAPKGPVGRMQGDLTWDPAKNERKAELKIDGVSREFLNPLLAASAPVQLSDGKIDAQARVQGAGQTVEFSMAFKAEGLSFQMGDRQTAPTPPISIKIDQNGKFQLDDQLADLRAVSMSVERQGKPLLDLQLEQPIQLRLGGASGAGQALSQAAARLRLGIHDLTLETARPWLALAGVADAGGLTAGALNGQWTIDVQRQGEQIGVDGWMEGTGLKLQALVSPPLQVRQELQAMLVNFSEFSVKTAKIKASSDSRALADLAIDGAFKLADRSGQATLKLEVPETLDTLRRLGLLTGPPPQGVTDGRFRVTQLVKLNGMQTPATVEGEVALEGATLAMRGGAPAALGARVSNRLSFEPQTGRLTIGQLRMQLDQPAPAKPGTLQVEGDWPLTGADTEGRLQCVVSEVDLAPWLQLTRALATETIPRIPLEAEETVERLKGGKIRVKGEVRIGLPAGGPGGNEPLALAVRNELEQWGDRIEHILVVLEGKPASGAADQVRIEGSGLLGKRTDLNLNVNVENFNADPYLTAANVLAGPPQPAAPPPSTPPTAPPVLVEAQWTVGKAAFHKTELTDAGGNLRLENGVMQVSIDKGKLAGGELAGSASYDMARIQPRYDWKLSLKQAAMAALAGAADPALAQKLTGTASFESQGSGEGLGEAMGRHLDGTSHFSIKDGELKGLPFLDKLSELTNAESFRNLRFFEFAGNVNFERGQGKIVDTFVAGKENKLALSGTFGIDGRYNVRIDPYLARQLLGKGSTQQYASLAADAQGFVRLPLSLEVAGQGAQYTMRPTAALPIAGGAGGQPPSLDQAVRGVLGGIVEQKLNERTGKEEEKKTGDQPTTATATTTDRAVQPQASPTPETTPKPSREDVLRDALGGLLQGRNP